MLKAGVVGCGNVIGTRHAQEYISHERTELVCVCDLIREKADSLAEKLGTKAYYSVHDMLQEEDLDVVSVCTTDTKHYEPTMQCLEKRVHVLCEKPLAMNSEEAAKMVQKAREIGCFLGVNYNRRFSPFYTRGHRLVQQGKLGKLAYLDMKLCQGGEYAFNRGQGKYYLLFELQVHSLDMLRYFGGEVEEVYAQFTNPAQRPIYTTCIIQLRFCTGALGTLIGSYDGGFSHPIERLEVGGVQGYLVVDNVMDGLHLCLHEREEEQVWKSNVLQKCDFSLTFSNHIKTFIDRVSEGKNPPITGMDGLRSLQIAEAAVRSFREHISVKPY